MRKLILAVALASSVLMTGGCATIHNVDQAVALANQNVGDFTIADEKGWYYAEALYDVPATAYLSANSRGLLQDPLKSQLKAMLHQLNDYRQGVYQAYKTANSVTFREKLQAMKALSDQIRSLVPRSTSQAAPLGVPSAELAARVAQS
jgi:uncharacterized protein YceK